MPMNISSDIKPVTYADLRELFGGRDFIRKLNQAAKETLKYWDETEFNVARSLYRNELLIGDVISIPDAMDSPWESAYAGFSAGLEHLIKELDIYEKKVFPLVIYHTHPPTSSSAPSEDDLINMADMREWSYRSEFDYKYDNRPLLAIGSLPDKRRLDVLVLQEKSDEPMGLSGAEFVFGFVESHHNYRCHDNEAVARLYDMTNELRAALLTYHMNRNGEFSISDDELKKLERFAYAITLLPQNKVKTE